jgi:hypothetical protein
VTTEERQKVHLVVLTLQKDHLEQLVRLVLQELIQAHLELYLQALELKYQHRLQPHL